MRHIRNIVRYVILFLLNLYVMLAFHSYLNFIFLVIMLATPVISFIAVWLVSRGIKVSFGMPGEALKAGEEFVIRFQIDNPVHIPLVNAYLDIWLSNPFYGHEQTYSWNLPIQAKRQMELSYPFIMEHCGRVVIRAKGLRLDDLLGLFSWKKALDAEGECLVLPNGRERSQEIERAGLRGQTEAVESREKGYDFSEVNDVREYQAGDLLKDIHWKLSVKKDELMVKERVGLADLMLNVVLELTGGDSIRLDALLALADGITRSMVQKNLLFTVFYYSVSRGQICEFPVSGEAERRQWLELMLYDRVDRRAETIRKIFENEHPGGIFLYIGFDDGTAGEGAIYGEQGTVAVLVNG